MDSADIKSLLKGEGVYLRAGRVRFAPNDSAELQQKAGREAERKRQTLAGPSDVITPKDYDKYQIPLLNEFPAGKLDWTHNPNRLTLINAMPQVGQAFENAVCTCEKSPEVIQKIRAAIEQEVRDEYKDNEESEEEMESKLPARCGCFLLREMATKLK